MRIGLSTALQISFCFGLLTGLVYWAAMMVLVLSDPEGLAYIGFIMFSATAGCIVVASCILGLAVAASYNFFAKHATGLEIDLK